jgi:hypothetical protein
MTIRIDPNSGGLIPEGTHQLTVNTLDMTESRKGDPMLVVELGDMQDRTVTDWIVLTPKVIEWKLRALWEAAGLTWPTETSDIDENELIDKTITATVIHQRRDGFLNAKIDTYHPVGEPGSDIPDDQQAFAVNTPAAAPQNAIDDEIPF